MDKEKKIQDMEYEFPYHYLVDLENFCNYRSLVWGFEYYNNLNFIISVIKNIKFTNLLDLGCGDGRLLYELAKIYSDKKMIGVDVSLKAIKFAQAFNYGNANEFKCGDVNNIQAKFDLITIVEVLEHIPDNEIESFIKSADNKLDLNGKILLSAPSDNFEINPKHYRHYNIDLIKKTFPDFIIKESHFVAKKSWYFFSVFITNLLKNRKYQKFIADIIYPFIIKGKENDCTNIVCILERKN